MISDISAVLPVHLYMDLTVLNMYLYMYICVYTDSQLRQSVWVFYRHSSFYWILKLFSACVSVPCMLSGA